MPKSRKKPGTRPHLVGMTSVPIDQRWKDAAEAALKELGRGSRVKLAEHLNVTPGTISSMFRAETKHSRFALATSVYLGIASPLFENQIDEIFFNNAAALKAEDPEAYDQLVKEFLIKIGRLRK